MRRHLQKVSDDLAYSWLKNARTGIFSVVDDGYPYQIPVNFVVIEDSIYFHCAKQGKKLELIETSNKVGFCIVEKDTVVPEQFSTDYGSVIAQGQATILEDDALKKDVLYALCLKYSKDYMHLFDKEYEGSIAYCEVVKIKISSISGKVSKNRIKEVQ